jgi:broad specificity phosphatase PhoE
LVRHGETEWNRVKRIQGGNSDIPLNERGEQQAEDLALRLRAEDVQAIYSSPLQRSLNTAKTIARYHEMKVGLEPDLVEVKVGEFEGTMLADLGKALSEFLIAGSQGEVLPRVPGGESLVEVQQRAWSVIQRLIGQHSEGVIVVVSHYFTILAVICLALNLPLSQVGRLGVDYCSMSTLVFDGQAPRLVLLNDTCHLMNG